MNDYFDALEHELKAAVPRAARSHRRARTLARLPLFRLGSLLLLAALALVPALALTGGLTGTGGHRQPAARQTHQKRHRAPRHPNEMTLLKGLVALRRRTDLTSLRARSVQQTMRWTASAPVTSLLRFAAGTAAVGIQSVLVSTRRRIKDAPHATTSGALHLTLVDPQRCGARQHARTSHTRQVSHTASRALVCDSTTSPQQIRNPDAGALQAVRRPGADSTQRSSTSTIHHFSKPATFSTRAAARGIGCQSTSPYPGTPLTGMPPSIRAATAGRTSHPQRPA